MTEINGMFKNTKGARMAQGEKLTNFERIKSMSLEEMAEMLDKSCSIGGIMDKICTAVNPEQNCETGGRSCIRCIKRWLKSEVE